LKFHFSLKLRFQFQYNLVLISFLILTFIFSSCNTKSQISEKQSESKLKNSFTIKDDIGVEIKFDSIPKKIISLAPNITEVLFAIGAESVVSGVTDLCDFPPEAKLKTKTGNYLSPDYETITSLNPDLVIMYVENSSQPTYQALKNMGLKIFVSNAKNINGVFEMIKDFGVITGREGIANKIADSLSLIRDNYVIANKDTISTLLIISVNPLMTANKNTFVNEISELAGFQNIYKNESIDYPMISYEDVNFKNPEFIILPTDTTNEQNYTKFVNELNGKLNNLSAVKGKKIILIDDNVMFRPGPRVLEGVYLLKNKLNNFR